MTEKTYNIGDVVAWGITPMKTAVLKISAGGIRSYVIKTIDGLATWCGRWIDGKWFWRLKPYEFPFAQAIESNEQVTIIALGLTGDETAADLQRLAEVFEVRDALHEFSDGTVCLADDLYTAMTQTVAETWQGLFLTGGRQSVAERLHAAGWRPGMSAEDAARLLAEAK